MKRNRIIFIIILIIIILLLTITSFSVYMVKKLQYTSDGAVIVVPGETDMNDLPSDTRMVIAVESPENNENNDTTDIQKPREEFAQENLTTPENPPSTDFEISDEEIENNPYLRILVKYHDKNEIIQLYKNLYVETYGLHTANEEKKPITDTQIRLYEITVELTQRDDVSEEDKKYIEELLNGDDMNDVKNAYEEKK